MEHNRYSNPGNVHMKFCNRVCISSNKSVDGWDWGKEIYQVKTTVNCFLLFSVVALTETCIRYFNVWFLFKLMHTQRKPKYLFLIKAYFPFLVLTIGSQLSKYMISHAPLCLWRWYGTQHGSDNVIRRDSQRCFHLNVKTVINPWAQSTVSL